MARLGGCRYLGMTMILVVALVCFAFSTTSCIAAEAEVIKEVINKTGAGWETGLPAYGQKKFGPWGYNPLTSLDNGQKSFGPWGYHPFMAFDHSGYDGIKSIKIRHTSMITEGLQVTYVKDGQAIETPAVGGSGDTVTEIHLDYPDEYIYLIRALVGPSPYAASSMSGLQFLSNRNLYGPFGFYRGNESEWIRAQADGNPIRGLFGQIMSQKFLVMLGIYVTAYGETKFGPWGYNAYRSFFHSGYDGIKSIKIRHGTVIYGIQVTYVKDGQTIETPAVGGSDGTLTEIRLNYPDEYIFSITGHGGPISFSPSAITQLRIYTNWKRASYGPFGTHIGDYEWTAFDARAGTGKPIRGLFGEIVSHKYLGRIGVYGDA